MVVFPPNINKTLKKEWHSDQEIKVNSFNYNSLEQWHTQEGAARLQPPPQTPKTEI
jgi:hypothetical protein